MELLGFHVPAQLLGAIVGLFVIMLAVGAFNFVAMNKRENAIKARNLVAEKAAADHASRLITQKTGFIGPKRAIAVDARREVAQVQQV